MNYCTWKTLLLLLLTILIPSISTAETVTIKAVGEYIMGDNDTFTEGKRLALQDAKRLALEKVGTYIESTTEVKSRAVSIDEIKSYTAGIIKVEVIDEQRYTLDSKATVVKITVSAVVDPDAVVRQIIALQKRKDVEETAKKMTSENDLMRKEIVLLNRQLRDVTDAKKSKELRDQRDLSLQKIIDNEKGLTILVSGAAMKQASLYDQQRKEDKRQLIRIFLQEVVDAYQITADEPQLVDNGDRTSKVTINFRLKLSGNYSLDRSSISVPSIGEFLSNGFVIKAFFNGGLLISCSDSRNSICNSTLRPYFAEEANKIYVSIKLGDYAQRVALGFSEAICNSMIEGICWGGKWSDMYYPLVSGHSYTHVFDKIPHRELEKVSKIEIKIIYK